MITMSKIHSAPTLDFNVNEDSAPRPVKTISQRGNMTSSTKEEMPIKERNLQYVSYATADGKIFVGFYINIAG